MKRTLLTIASLVAPLIVAACATNHSTTKTAVAAAAKPTTQPQVVLPEAVIPVLAAQAIEDTPAPAAAPTTQALPPVTQTLPKGHPDISKMQAPEGMPGGMGGGMPAMPSGHPDISKMKKSASSQPAMIGSINVRGVQGTANGPAIGQLPVVVELYQNETMLDKREAKLSADGTATLDAIPVGLNVTPVVRITYKGVEYATTGGAMDGEHPQQDIQIPVFETTDQKPDWSIHMQHVMLQPTTEGVSVMEMLAIENPADRAWLGKDGKTLVFTLPEGAKDIQLIGGFPAHGVKVEGNEIIQSVAFVPGVSQYRIAYTLPVNAGKAEFSLVAPAQIKHLMVFVPDDGSAVAAEGVAGSGTADMGNGKTRFYKAADLATGAVVKLHLSNITATPAPAAVDEPVSRSASTGAATTDGQGAKILAGAGGLAIFVVGGFLLFLKAPKAAVKPAKKARA